MEAVMTKRPIRYKNETYNSIADLSRHVGLSRITLNAIVKSGENIEHAIERSINYSPCQKIIVNGDEFDSIKEAARYYNLGYSCVHRRLKSGWPIEEAFGLKQQDTNCNGRIYMIYNTENSKVYIGITVQKVLYRFNKHINDAHNGSQCKLHIAMRSLGVECFGIKVLDRTNCRIKLRELEKRYIERYNSIKTGYNENFGGGAFGNETGRIVEYDGQTFKSIRLLAEHLGMKYSTLVKRINEETPLEAPLISLKKKVFYNNQIYESATHLAKELNMEVSTLSNRIRSKHCIDAPKSFRLKKGTLYASYI